MVAVDEAVGCWFHCFSSVSWIVLIIIATTIAWIGTAQGLKLTRISAWICTAVTGDAYSTAPLMIPAHTDSLD